MFVEHDNAAATDDDDNDDTEAALAASHWKIRIPDSPI